MIADKVQGPRIVVTRTMPEPAIAMLREIGDVWVSDVNRPLSAQELHDAAVGAHALVTMLHDRIDTAVLTAAGKSLRVVANVAVGHDNVVDSHALAARGVALTNTPGVLTDATADLTMGLILMATRRLGEGERLLRAGTPWSFHLGFMLGPGLQGKTLGIVGLGQIGRAVAQRARAFGMHVAYTGRSPATCANEVDVQYMPLHEMLTTADVISLHCPLTPATWHLIDANALALMKPTAFLVNTSRGPVVDESALAEALQNRTIAGAALDVFEKEPEVEPRLLDLDNAVVAPHLGSATVETRTAMALLAARNVVSVLSGDGPITPVTLQARHG
ncbi:D-glycerate dehydrogenase [Saccharopolyspora sp. WRP15-2]|uniref:D-glycerate dehydrogenase n=1 Tax=Saccharopolyspora oryzae TaxID=2997343 RepID=A0ABT4V9J6_9PSEU|nr:D-glycerate dehydrogenase [Saccharopolyspora oryzae]MDA3630635.1 D-glycerate dehydrogenase [Saccharopolyspora oryzae]